MPWYMQWSESITRRVVRYLLHKFVGQFLKEKLTLDQLTFQFFNGSSGFNGTGSVSGVVLDVQSLNEVFEQANLPIEFVDGFVSELNVYIPITRFLTESTYVELTGTILTVQPKQRADDGSSMFESMWTSMTNSMQLAAECLQHNCEDKTQENIQPVEGIEVLALAIESCLTRLKIKLVNTVLRLEHLPKQCNNGLALEIRIANIDYCDEASGEMPSDEPTFPPSAFSVKKLHCEGVFIFTDEFPAMKRTFSRQMCEERIESCKSATEPIQLGKLSGRQDVRLKIKKDESVSGPKVELDLTLGSLTVFSSPRQLHLIIEMMKGLSSPHIQDTSNVPHRDVAHKPMSSGDYDRIERDLQEALGNDRNASRWSFSSSEEEFLPMRSGRNLSDSVHSDISMESSMNSNYTSASSKTSMEGLPWARRRSSKQRTHSDSDGEITTFTVRIASAAVVLLHEDILTFSTDTHSLTKPSISTMKNMADTFFQNLGVFSLQGYGIKDFEGVKRVLIAGCKRSHLRLLAAGLRISGNQTGGPSSTWLDTVVEAGSVELVECLCSNNSEPPEVVDLLCFMSSPRPPSQPVDPHFPISNLSQIKARLRQQKKYRHSHQLASIKTDISVTIQQSWTEIDVSIIDRISSIIRIETLCLNNTPVKLSLNEQSMFSKAIENASTPDIKFDFEISCPFLVVKFRFPIPDLRPLHDVERSPWWTRSVRKDILYLHLIEPLIQTESNNRTSLHSYKISCSEIIGLYEEGLNDTPIVFARATGDNTIKPGKIGRCLGLPSVSFRICPKEAIGELDEIVDDVNCMTKSVYIEQPQKQPSPFASKHVVHGNVESGGSGMSSNEGEELIVPADKSDMTDFISYATRTSRFQVDVSLPFIAVHLPSKHFYEVLYNRINSDLSLWQSSAHAQDDDGHDYNSHPLYPAFSFCKSGLMYDSDSDQEHGNTYYKHKSKQAQHLNGQNKLALSISINQGMLNVVTNVRDTSYNIIPGQQGELQFNLEGASAFVVTYYKGQPQENYVCVMVNDAALYHKAVRSRSDIGWSSENATYQPPHWLDATIFRSNGAREDMLTAAVHTHVSENRIKTIRVSCAIRGATLRHRVCIAQHSWLTQLMDFFDVVDYPVRGYDSPQVITELHQHIWQCTVDYRPLHLPLRTAVTVSSLSVSSNIAARTRTSSLRFIAEDASLYLCENGPPGPGLDLRKHYVRIVELSLFELTLRLGDRSDRPKVDIRASNNVLHVRTCSDSARAFGLLIKYLASDGDLGIAGSDNDSPKKKDSADGSPCLIQTSHDDALSKSTVDRVHSMMEEAMQDEDNDYMLSGNCSSSMPATDVFLFPDEGLSVAPVDWAAGSDSDSDFCLLDHEAGCGMMPKSGLPEVRQLSSHPIIIVDNHFCAAVGKADLLMPPKHYPIPVFRYTLQDVTIVWQMYGGRDFSDKKGDSYFNDGGGAGRDRSVLLELQLNKVKLQHEVYPEKCVQASRQVLLIHDVEIRDRLKSSRINKFLYLYTSEASPRQSHANMVVMKIVHIRPDPRRREQETCVKMSLLPLRVNIDQDSLLFLITFMTELAGVKGKAKGNTPEQPTTPHRVPVMAVEAGKKSHSEEQPALLIMFDEESTVNSTPVDSAEPSTSSDSNNGPTPLYIRSFVFSPQVPIRIDYEGKRVDMTHGPLAGLLMGLGQLSCLQINLKKIYHRHGLLGVDRLVSFVLNEWVDDIKRNQLPSILGGVGPMHSIVQLVQGVRDLFWMPIEQYQRDGRIVRGLQRGASSFTTSTALAALEVTARVVAAIQAVAEITLDLVSPGPARRGRGRRGGPPADLREGVAAAVALVREGAVEAAGSLVRAAAVEADAKGPVGAVGGILRQIPPTVVTPIVIASAATSNLLGGVRSHIAPDVRREASCKWKSS